MNEEKRKKTRKAVSKTKTTKKKAKKVIDPADIININGNSTTEEDLSKKIYEDYMAISHLFYRSLPVNSELGIKDKIINGITVGQGSESIILNTYLSVCVALLQKNFTFERKSILMHMDNLTNALMFQKYKMLGNKKLSIYADVYYLGIMLSIYWTADGIITKEAYVKLYEDYGIFEVICDNEIEITSIYAKYSESDAETCKKLAVVIHSAIQTSKETYENILKELESSNETTEQE